MGHTVIGVFRHSGDADLAAAHLRDEYTLTAARDLDVIGQAEWDRLSRPALDGVEGWLVASVTGIGLDGSPSQDESLGKRWSDKVWDGETLVVARTYDPEIASAMARDLRVTGADRVDLIPHD